MAVFSAFKSSTVNDDVGRSSTEKHAPRHDESVATDEGAAATSRMVKHNVDADDALQAYAEFAPEDLVLDEATNKRLLRRIDLFLMPIMCTVYLLNYLDKTALSYASVMGLRTDIHLVRDNYQWLGSLFYFGYLGWEYPTNFLLQRMPLGKYSAINVILWGVILSCFAAVSNFQGAVAIRFFLGLFESAVTPGFTLLTSQWYTKREQAFRTGLWFSFNGWAQLVGGFVAYGIAVGSERHGSLIAPWKALFLATGLFTVACGVLFLFLVPDNQLNARWLSKKDRVLAVERIRQNEQGVGNKHWKAYQFREALTDPLTWLFFLYSLVSDIPNGGISNFFSQLIVSFGYTQQQSLLYGTPGGAIEVVTIVGWGFITYYYGNRLFWGACSMAIALLGMILIVALPLHNSVGRLIGYYLTQASATPFVALLSMISSNVAGYTKKTTVAALFLIAYCVGNIIGPQVFRPKDAPRYVPATITICVMYGTSIIILGFIYMYCKYQNGLKARIRAAPGYTKLENHEFLDLTDRENPEFVYVT